VLMLGALAVNVNQGFNLGNLFRRQA
jgi:hypothetical protein